MEALAKYGKPEMFYTDEGSQYTPSEFTEILIRRGIKISIDGKGRALDNLFEERLCRTVKYNEIYLKSYSCLIDAHQNLDKYYNFDNNQRPHSSLGDRYTPIEYYRKNLTLQLSAWD